jgi:hypothetical protein
MGYWKWILQDIHHKLKRMHQDFRALGRKKQGAGDLELDPMEQTIPGN